jgi:hypothetical protein
MSRSWLSAVTACLVLAAATAQDPPVQPADPKVNDAGDCALGGEGSPNPRHAIISCGSHTISKILWGEYGTPSGKCTGGKPFAGHGDAHTFKTNPACHLDITKKLAEMCIGKDGGKHQCSIPAWNGNVVFGIDPCPNVGKWVGVVVECSGSSWGWALILTLFVGGIIYVTGGVWYMHKVHGKAIGVEALPHREYWTAGYGLVQDGVMYTYHRVQQARGVANTDGKYEAVPEVTPSSQSPTPKKKALKVKTVAAHVERHPVFGKSMGSVKASAGGGGGGRDDDDDDSDEDLVE